MNTFNVVTKDLMKAFGNIATAGATVVVVASTELAKGTGALTGAVVAAPGFIKELAASPVTATAAYQAEDQGIEYDVAYANIMAAMPSDASEAVKASAKAVGTSLAKLLKEEA